MHGRVARRTLRPVSDALPTGTVTFLFTDVEGSTRLLEELGAEAYAGELGRHRDIVRDALSRARRRRGRHAGRRVLLRLRFGAGGRRVRSGDPGCARGWARSRSHRRPHRRGARRRSALRRDRRASRGAYRRVWPRGAGRDLALDGCVARTRRVGPSRPRPTQAQGSRCPRRPPSAGRPRAPAAQDAVPDEPTGPGDALPRSRRGALDLVAHASEPGVRSPYADRAGRNGEDATLTAACGGARRVSSRRNLVGSPRAAAGRRERRVRCRERSRHRGRGRPPACWRRLRARSRESACSSCWTIASTSSGPLRSSSRGSSPRAPTRSSSPRAVNRWPLAASM